VAGFRTHITVSTGLGIVYGGAAVQPMGFPTETAVLAAGLTAVGGMLPDLDSDSGVPVREMFGLAAAVVPLMATPRLIQMGVSLEGRLAFMLFSYLVIRYGLSLVFKYLTVHRGMYHSIPAMLIAGLLVYLAYHSPHRPTRVLLAVGVMVGFLSHLVLDEIYSVNFNGVRFKLKASAGSAVKLFSPSFVGTAVCYLLLGALCYLTYQDVSPPP
jgi:membrane-bound metal-dependent hydrolase YbcI (DUF457 family)